MIRAATLFFILISSISLPAMAAKPIVRNEEEFYRLENIYGFRDFIQAYLSGSVIFQFDVPATIRAMKASPYTAESLKRPSKICSIFIEKKDAAIDQLVDELQENGMRPDTHDAFYVGQFLSYGFLKPEKAVQILEKLEKRSTVRVGPIGEDWLQPYISLLNGGMTEGLKVRVLNQLGKKRRSFVEHVFDELQWKISKRVLQQLSPEILERFQQTGRLKNFGSGVQNWDEALKAGISPKDLQKSAERRFERASSFDQKAKLIEAMGSESIEVYDFPTKRGYYISETYRALTRLLSDEQLSDKQILRLLRVITEIPKSEVELAVLEEGNSKILERAVKISVKNPGISKRTSRHLLAALKFSKLSDEKQDERSTCWKLMGRR